MCVFRAQLALPSVAPPRLGSNAVGDLPLVCVYSSCCMVKLMAFEEGDCGSRDPNPHLPLLCDPGALARPLRRSDD